VVQKISAINNEVCSNPITIVHSSKPPKYCNDILLVKQEHIHLPLEKSVGTFIQRSNLGKESKGPDKITNINV
jgi:hypothetical protein